MKRMWLGADGRRQAGEAVVDVKVTKSSTGVRDDTVWQ